MALAAESGRYDGFIAIGVVIRGETYHFEIVAGESARGLMALALDGLAVGNGILTVEDEAQAIARADPAQLVADAAHPDANIIFGAVIDDALGDEVRVTVIAAGFDGGMPKRAKEGAGLRRNQPAQTQPAQSQQETLNAARALGEAKRTEGAKIPRFATRRRRMLTREAPIRRPWNETHSTDGGRLARSSMYHFSVSTIAGFSPLA